MLSLVIAIAAATADIPHYIAPVCAGPGSGFGYRIDPYTGRNAFHAGLDFEVAIGTPVFASAAGKVMAAEQRGPYGLMIEIDHGGGHKTRYGHLSELAVKADDEVAQGAIIAKSGATGRAQVPGLHFEIWRNEVVHDPRLDLHPNPRCETTAQ